RPRLSGALPLPSRVRHARQAPALRAPRRVGHGDLRRARNRTRADLPRRSSGPPRRRPARRPAQRGGLDARDPRRLHRDRGGAGHASRGARRQRNPRARRKGGTGPRPAFGAGSAQPPRPTALFGRGVEAAGGGHRLRKAGRRLPGRPGARDPGEAIAPLRGAPAILAFPSPRHPADAPSPAGLRARRDRGAGGENRGRIMSALSSRLFEREVIVCVGAGGVGKTTVAATVALQAALSGKRAIVLTIDPARRLANALGLAELGNQATRVELPDAPGELWAMMLDLKRSWDEFITRTVSTEHRDAILRNRFYQTLSSSLAGSQEY